MAEESVTPNSTSTVETGAQASSPREDPAPAETSEPERSEAESGGERGGDTVSAHFGETHADKIVNANAVYEVFVSGSGEDFALRTFSAEYCASVSEQREQEICETVIADEKLAARLFGSLTANRFLILTGEPEIGKKTLALHLSYMARRASRQPGRETYLVRPLQRRVTLELQRVAENREDFGQRVIVFPQVGEGDNRDLLDLFARLKEFELDKIVRALEESDSYLLFTADTPHIKSLRDDLKRLDILHEVDAPSASLLERALEKKVERFLSTRNVPVESAAAARTLVKEHKGLLAARLAKMSRIALFVERYLLDIVGENAKLDVWAAVEIVGSPERWFLEDLGKDFEAWCFVFTLGLCQCGPQGEGVPWLEFETMRREITRHLAREVRMWRQEPAFASLLEEQTLLEKARAQVVREAGVGDLVRFVDGSYPARLWRVFTNSNRRALTSILPVLNELSRSDDPRIRACAGKVLGRIGEINPPHITFAAIREWAAAKPLWRKAAVAYLYEGALLSPDEGYRQMCLAKLESMSLSGRRDELWTAIAVYKQIGQGGGDKLALAVSKLGEITGRNFTGWIEWEKKIEQRLEQYTRRKNKDFQELLLAAKSVQTLKELRQELRQVYDEDNRIMLAISYSLVALSLQLGAFAVIVELNKWFQQGRRELAALTSWIYWTEEGIADRLAEYRVPVLHETAGGGAVRGCHPLVVSLGHACRQDPHAARQTAHFLAATYTHISEHFPPRMRQLLQKKFLQHLKNWVDGTWRVKEYRQVMSTLYVELLHSPDPEMAETLRDHLRSDADFTGKAHLKRFAESVLNS